MSGKIKCMTWNKKKQIRDWEITSEGKVWPVDSEPHNSYEVRISVFGSKNVPAEDAEGTSDAYIRAFFDEADSV